MMWPTDTGAGLESRVGTHQPWEPQVVGNCALSPPLTPPPPQGPHSRAAARFHPCLPASFRRDREVDVLSALTVDNAKAFPSSMLAKNERCRIISGSIFIAVVDVVKNFTKVHCVNDPTHICCWRRS